MNEEGRKPIMFEFDVDVRFAELDFYGHVNLSKYLDIVVTSRFLYLERVLKISLAETAKAGVAFYTAKAFQEFLRPIKGLQRVRVKSFVEKVNDTRLEVPYEIYDAQGKVLYSKGLLTFAIMDLKTNRPCPLPDSAKDWLFEKN